MGRSPSVFLSRCGISANDLGNACGRPENSVALNVGESASGANLRGNARLVVCECVRLGVLSEASQCDSLSLWQLGERVNQLLVNVSLATTTYIFSVTAVHNLKV